MKTGTLVLAAAAMLGSPASAQFLLWDNYPFGSNPSYKSSQLDLVYPFDAQMADDFEIDGSWFDPIDAVEWNGGFWNGTPLTVPEWRIIFYDDDGGRPTGGPDDPTGTARAVFTMGADDVQVTPESDGSYTYYTEALKFYPEIWEGRMWIAIQPVLPFPPQWGISEAAGSLQGYESQFGFPLLGYDYWTPVSEAFGDEFDMAFRLYAIPGPGALVLLGLAGFAPARRR
jgi:hypothetical protein